MGLDQEIIFKWAAIHGDFAGAGRQANARDGGFTAARSKNYSVSAIDTY